MSDDPRKSGHKRRVTKLRELVEEIQMRTGVDVRREPLGNLDELVYRTHEGAHATAQGGLPDPKP